MCSLETSLASSWRNNKEGNDEAVATSLAFLERAAQSSDPLLENLVAVSFVENVGPWDPEAADFISGWPPRLQEMAHEQGWVRRSRLRLFWLRLLHK